MFDLAALESALAERSLPASCISLPLTDSTNNDALEAAATVRRTARSTLPMSSGPGADGAITPGTRPRAKGFMSACCCGRGFPPRVCRCFRWPRACRSRCNPRSLWTHGRSALAQRSAHWPAQDRRHPGGSAHRGQTQLRLPWWASASTCISAASIRASARPRLRSIWKPADAFRASSARLPAKIAGARDACAARSGDGETIPARVEQASTWVRGRRLKCMARRPARALRPGWTKTDSCWCAPMDGLVTVQTGGIRAAEMKT
jgi:hypothetical protein